MARLLYGCLFILRNAAVTLDWKAFLSVKNYFYQHQNITIIIKGEGETCPNFWNRHIILSLKFIGSWSCRFVFLVLNLIFPPSRFSVLSSSRSLCYLPHFAPTASRKKNKQPKIFFRVQCETKGWLKIMYQSNRSLNIPPPGQPPGHLNFWKIFVQIPHSRGRKAVQMPHYRSIPGDQIPPHRDTLQ